MHNLSRNRIMSKNYYLDTIGILNNTDEEKAKNKRIEIFITNSLLFSPSLWRAADGAAFQWPSPTIQRRIYIYAEEMNA